MSRRDVSNRSDHEPNQAHEARVHQALDTALERARAKVRELSLTGERYVIFSDLHRGARNGADDFAASEEAYVSALEWYLKRDYAGPGVSR